MLSLQLFFLFPYHNKAVDNTLQETFECTERGVIFRGLQFFTWWSVIRKHFRTQFKSYVKYWLMSVLILGQIVSVTFYWENIILYKSVFVIILLLNIMVNTSIQKFSNRHVAVSEQRQASPACPSHANTESFSPGSYLTGCNGETQDSHLSKKKLIQSCVAQFHHSVNVVVSALEMKWRTKDEYQRDSDLKPRT